MRWIDGADWDKERGFQLVELFAAASWSKDDSKMLVEESGIERQLLNDTDDPIVRWSDFISKLFHRNLLGQFLDYAAEVRPKMAAKLLVLAEATPLVVTGNPPDPFQVRLVGAGRRPVIDRADLRRHLEVFLRKEMKVLIVNGPARCGKTFSFRILMHVVSARNDLKLDYIDFTQEGSGNKAFHLMNAIRLRLNLPPLAENIIDTTEKRNLRDLVNEFVGHYKPIDGKTRILVIDGLNRGDLDPDVHDLVVNLAVEVINQQLINTQVVLIGYAGSFDRDLDDELLIEDITPITEAHVRHFFQGLISERDSMSEDLELMVRQAMAGGTADVEALGRRVRDLALRLIDA